MKTKTIRNIKQLAAALLVAGISLAGFNANAQNTASLVSQPQVVEADFINNILIYPIPTQDNVIIRGNIIVQSNIRIVVTDILGRTLFERDENAPAGAFEKQFNLSSLPNGYYLLAIRVGDQVVTRRLIKD